MGVETFAGEMATGKRATRRARVLLAAKLRLPDGEVDARLRDLSPKGALIECAAAPRPGIQVVFVRGGTEIAARVAWAAAGRIGLEFDHLIDAQEMLVQLRKGPKGEDRYRAPVAPQRAIGAAQLRLARSWGVTVGLSVPEAVQPRRRRP
jgi:hypothetical protein